MGYLALLPILYQLSPQTGSSQSLTPHTPEITLQDPSSSSSSPISSRSPPRDPHKANSHILALLFAHILSNNYSTLSIFDESTSSPDSPADSLSKLGETVISHGAALPLLWAYLWGHPQTSGTSSIKGKEKATPLDHKTWAGEFEGTSTDQVHMVELTFRILLASAGASAANLFAITKNLPWLASFLLSRLYGFAEKRKYETTFPGHDWLEHEEDDEDDQDVKWIPPSDSLRPIYLALLRKLLEAGVDQEITWRLFTLVRPGEKISIPPAQNGNPNGTTSSFGGIGSKLTEEPASEPTTTPMTKKGRRPLNLMMPAAMVMPVNEKDRLDPEVLDLIKHSMKARWPPAFVFRVGKGEEGGGLEMRDMGRPWPLSSKGFSFSVSFCHFLCFVSALTAQCWVYITKLEHPITLLHASQARSKYPLVQIRILENSQIGFLTSIHSDTPGTPSPPEELVCPAPDALIPHNQWVHFSLACRKVSDFAEARIFVNGVRVGTMRVNYPVPSPPATTGIAPQLGVKPAIPLDAVRLSVGRELTDGGDSDKKAAGGMEENEWMLGRLLLLDDGLSDDVVLLLHHLVSHQL